MAIILAGGKGERLKPFTEHTPKALLPIRKKVVIDYVMDKIEHLREVRESLILVNPKFQRQFKKWLEQRGASSARIISDKEEKVGAVKALADAVQRCNDDFLVICSDNLFDDDLTGFLGFFHEKNRSPVMALYHAKTLEETKRGSRVVIDADNRIVEFEEKPVFPTTVLVGACIYAFPLEIRARFKEYLSTGLGIDEPGRFVEWLHKKQAVYGYELKGDLKDIGTVDSYVGFKTEGFAKKRTQRLP